ncbi:hypothetical protein [Tenggerimyces flavus]|uniref:ParB/Sulfiredoxin domain-containing protein n=1 Tax=Tenggerimyces flavus TaxID=1708749 RepID=A0ABV7Y8E9_9ACTN|nr:hypothetical protein [Tenggerimyces flavus]MBM7783587.1 hypothetical protein [Tenggerimyces flavus]
MIELQPHPLFGQIPPALRDVLLDFRWDLERLWALEIEPTELDVDQLAWQLDLPFWRDGERFFAVTPREVASDPERHREQYERTLAADLSHPIHVLQRTDRLTILDGVHRLLKAQLQGARTITAKVVSPDQLSEIVTPPAGEGTRPR